MRVQAIALTLCIAGCSAMRITTFESGRVVDVDTGLPVENAYVVYTWKSYTPISGTTVCKFASVAKTNANGEFRVSNQGAPEFGAMGGGQITKVYYPGYQVVLATDKEVQIKKDGPEGRAERLRLTAAGLNCPEEGPTSLLAEMYRSISAEASKIGGPAGSEIADIYREFARGAEWKLGMRGAK